MPPSPTSRPNILLVVLDCVRAWDFPGGPDAVPGMPTVDRLRRESWEFPRAASVAHWTVPSHASLFTGLYPWQHGVHAKGKLALDPNTQQVDRMLRDSGYATLSVSANGLISPTLGFSTACDRAAWGVSLFNRFGEGTAPPQGSQLGSTRAATAEGFVRNRMKALSYWSAVYLARYPGFWDLGTRAVHRLRHPASPLPPRLAPWLEPTLERWVREVPADRPLYTFINLLDAHEPYLCTPSPEGDPASWVRYAGTRQDRLGWVSGEWSPNAEEFGRLHALYRGTLQLIDRRLERIIEAFRAAGRWDNTLMVLTSDHCQAFGEHGALFHINGIDEPEVRVPLIVRPPGGLSGPKSAQGWASLVDVVPTCLEAAGATAAVGNLHGVSLTSLFEAPRPGPVLALNDGLVHARDAARAPSGRRESLDRLMVGGYLDDRKVILDTATGQYRAFRIEQDRQETRDRWDDERADFAPISDFVNDVGRTLLGGADHTLGEEVEDRLKSWGYI